MASERSRRLNLQVSAEMDEVLDHIAEDAGTSRSDVIRQALALMECPNIAKVFDAGSTESGRPYFVMELIRGVKITEYCDQNSLTTEGTPSRHRVRPRQAGYRDRRADLMPARIDLDEALSARATISVDAAETLAEQRARLRTEREQARYEIVRAYLLLISVLIVIGLVTAICAIKILDPATPAETSRWTQTVLSSLLNARG